MSLYRRRNGVMPSNERITNISFSVFTHDELKQVAVKKIVTPLTFDPLGHPIPGGLYDKALGPMNDKSDPCGTCQKSFTECPGHMGYIELPLPVINPIFHQLIGTILRMSCLRCFTIQIPGLIKSTMSIQMRLLDCGMNAEALELENIMFSLAQKLESKESIPEQATQNIDRFDKLCRDKEGNPGFVVNNTKNTEQLRRQFLANITKFINKGKNCIFCDQACDRIKYQKNRLVLNYKSSKTKEDDFVVENLMKYVTPNESRGYLRQICKNELDFLVLLAPVLNTGKDMEYPTDIFYFEILPVPPPMSRPANYVKGKMSEHPKTNAYRAVLQNSIILNTIIYVMKQEGEDLGELSVEAKDVYLSTKGKTALEKLSDTWEKLQSNIDGILDKDTSRQNEFLGLKQIIEKKEGLLRMHIMGKRVNFSARSVITPDPNLKIDEIGIPDTFAKQLTYPTYVNSHNIEELRKMVMNGPDVHPGATMVEFQSGKMIRLDPKNPVQRESIAKRLLTPDEVKNHDYSEQKLVHRHLCNGDILLLNRQPSLHKPSVMAHKARILRGEKTFRLHYANCKAYNADFDGDEMNAHFPQTERARSEAYTLLNVSNQYLVPKDGTPLSGLIQDHVISGVKLSMRGQFFNKMDYQHLVFQGLYQKTRSIKLLPPTIIKPVEMWSGKQVLSTIIINVIPDGKELINLTSTSKIKSKDWLNTPSRPWKAGGTPFDDDLEMSESKVIIRKGELLSGVLDKAHYGATPFGLIHCMYELYGGACATEMLSSLTRLFTMYLQTKGFTLGVQDIMTLREADKKRRKIIKSQRKVGPEVMKKALNVQNDVSVDEIVEILDKKLVQNPNYTALIDREYKSNLNNFTNQMNSVSMSGLLSKFPDNNLQLMVISGAKGTTVNTMQMSCCLGQIELEGKRPPTMISGKTLPSFPAFEFSPRAGGFIAGRFMTGIDPQDFFFHCMAGREGLIDTACKTSKSGYLQRCLVKSLEGVHVKSDLTVRDSDNTVIQFLYGQDGMDVCKAQFLSEKQLPFLHENMGAILDKKVIKAEAKSKRSLEVKDYSKKLKEWMKENGSTLSKRKYRPFTLFSQFFNETSNRKVTKEQLVQLWQEAGEEVRQSFVDKCQPCPDTLNSRFLPHSHFGSINERLEALIEGYDGCKGKKDKRNFENMMKQKAMTSLCDSEEAVGLLAAQSIGEPSTQMTLNTFHFAGRGEMNVTLGIPRLREILMMASKNIKTPSMVIPFLPIEDLERESEALRKKFNRVTVADVLKDIEVEITSSSRTNSHRYTLKFVFLPHRQYSKDYCVNPKYIIKHMRRKFFKLMFQTIGKQNRFADLNVIEESRSTDRKARMADDDDDDDAEPASQDMPDPEVDSSDEEPEDEGDAKSRNKYAQVHDDQETEDEEMEEASIVDEEEEEQNSTKTKIDDNDQEFMDKYKMVEGLTYDHEKYLWCQMTFSLPFNNTNFDLTSVLKEVAGKSVIWEVPNIKKSITCMKDGVMTLRTDGINIPEMSKYDHILDLKKLYCNDIHKMIEHCGLGAGMDAIVKEIQDVFEVYGISIDPRHLMLISEFMTAKGMFEPMNRSGMQSSSSPFQQMSFESSLKFLRDAIIGGKNDSMKNPSSSLMAGGLCDVGTGGFDVVQRCI
ncbi:DNA-directed RNA polymerase I subunit RPA1 [Coccinella septempunctata]|uniref:DNA-directed RNA polymerase I subunit RPA1 n=1 Tax=Coccinella septempunctata TaxID=41139 RepID=UPI001D082B83|nr:DNA-directed RNA polymerase I subunit RPA1 [Coccinella septempunctata]